MGFRNDIDKFSLPLQNAPDSVKNTVDYGLQYFKYMYGRHYLWQGSYIPWRQDVDLNYLYMEGRQPERQYMDQFTLNRSQQEGSGPEGSRRGGSDESYMNINPQILPILPKFMDLLTSMIAKRKTKILVSAVNPVANSARDQKLYEMQFQMEHAKFIEDFQKETGVILEGKSPEEMPKTPEELEMYIQAGNLKLAEEIAAELGIEMVMGDDKWHYILPQLVQDIVCTGYAITREYLDKSGQLRVEAIRPREALLDFTTKDDYSNVRWGGAFKRMTASEFRAYASKYYSPEEITEILETALGRCDDYWMWDDIPYEIYDGREKYIVVLDGWFYSTNQLTVEEKEIEEGKVLVKMRSEGYEPPKDGKVRNLIQNEYEVIYKGCWVVGTDYLMDYGLQNGRGMAKNAVPNMQAVIHGNRNGVVKPYASRVRPVADMIQLTWLKFQNLVAKEPPPGFALSSDAVMGVMLGKGGAATLADLVMMHQQTGNMMVNMRDPINPEQVSQSMPIMPLNLNFSAPMQQAWANMFQGIDMIRQVFGFNDITDSSSPDPKTLVGVSENAIQATNNAIWPLMNSLGKLKINTARAVLTRIASIIRSGGDYTGYMNIGGDAPKYIKDTMGMGWRYVSLDKGLPTFDYEFEMEELLSEEQWAKINVWIQNQLSVRTQTGSGGIDLEDAIAIEGCRTYKQAQQMLAYRKKKRAEADMAKESELSQMRQQENMASQQAALQTKQAEMQILAQIEAQKVMLQEKAKQETLQVQFALEMKLQALKNQGLQQVQVVKGTYDLEKADIAAQRPMGQA